MNKDLTVGKPSQVLWQFCLPMFGSIIFQQLYNIADSLVAGKFIGENALAAVGNSYEITLIFIAFAFGCNIGCSVIVSRYFGAKEYREMKTSVYTSLIGSAVLCAVLMGIGLFGCDALLELINTPEEILADSALYLDIYVLGLPFMFFYNIATGIFSALGDSKTPFYFLAVSSLSNIGVDILFVAGFQMGIAGVAWATFLCQGVSCVLAMVVVFRRIRAFHTEGHVQLFSWNMLGKVAVVAVPSILQQSFISVGNITVGGSGKTPHVEYLVRLLKDKARVAVLSRGYKRKGKGFILADENTTMEEIGDEPFQMHRKFPDVAVAVEKKRVKGIELLQENPATKDVEVIVLDDAFQHRHVKPGINILLVDYHRLFIYDKLLPAGRLREPVSGKRRADIVIVTKCPKDLKPMEYRVLTKALDLFPYQGLYFTTINYRAPQYVFGGNEVKMEELKDHHVLLLAGIASPKHMEKDLEGKFASTRTLAFPDHHMFRRKDIARISEAFNALPHPRAIITTEKDAVRLRAVEGMDEEMKAHLLELPIQVDFMLEQENTFNEKIISYVRKNSRDSILVKRKDDHKPKDSHHTGNGPRTISFRDH